MSIDIPSIISFLLTGIVGLVVFFAKRLNDKVELTMTEQQIRQLIDDRLEPIHIKHQEIKGDLERLESKLDYLIELLLSKKK